jgi:hypothetical protein
LVSEWHLWVVCLGFVVGEWLVNAVSNPVCNEQSSRSRPVQHECSLRKNVLLCCPSQPPDEPCAEISFFFFFQAQGMEM